MPINYNDRHDLQEEEIRRQEARINERVTLLTNPQNIQQNSRIQTTRRHPQNIRDSLPSRGGKRTKRRNRRHHRKHKRKSRKKKHTKIFRE